eukprot:TRINITY_DN11815_c0_g2_i1.p1 TRINITY_DN11815_c0_g2~~TRINITY_DN11815_c0_g2_i1.p1  ORF type:complete len:488 (+),score=45.69 TRINITY_DN11815_c0_g2_i1:115-1464(+)
MGVPIFMAYNGGATAAIMDALQNKTLGHHPWDEAGVGTLGAMDKIGMTLAAPIWGIVMQRFSGVAVRRFLMTTLMCNSAALMIFSSTSNHFLMLLAKLVVGITEQSFWNWAPLWINRFGHHHTESWLTLSTGGMAAGIGNGLGMVLADVFALQAFKIESLVLFLLLIAFCFGTSPETIDPMADDDSVDFVASKAAVSLCGSLQFMSICLAYASANYAQTGAQFLWIEIHHVFWPDIFTSDPEMKTVASIVVLVISGVGGFIGMFLASRQDFRNACNLVLFTQRMFGVAVLGSMATMGSVAWRWYYGDYCLGYVSVLIIWIGTLFIFIGLGATPAPLNKLCMTLSKQEHAEGIGMGIFQFVNNLGGFALGMYLPMTMAGLADSLHWQKESEFLVAWATIILGILMGYFWMCGTHYHMLTYDEPPSDSDTDVIELRTARELEASPDMPLKR